MKKEEGRREVGLALLLLLVACELPLNTEAEAIAPIAAPPPLEEVVGTDGGGSDDRIVNSKTLHYFWYQIVINRLIKILLPIIRKFFGWVGGVLGHRFAWFCRLWQLVMDFLHKRIDWVLAIILVYLDPHHNFTSVRAFEGFTHYLFDILKYPGKWALLFLGHGPFAHCFKICFPPCLTHNPPGIASQVYCVLQLLGNCMYYDNHFHFMKPIPWPILTANFTYYYTPPQYVVYDPLFPHGGQYGPVDDQVPHN